MAIPSDDGVYLVHEPGVGLVQSDERGEGGVLAVTPVAGASTLARILGRRASGSGAPPPAGGVNATSGASPGVGSGEGEPGDLVTTADGGGAADDRGATDGGAVPHPAPASPPPAPPTASSDALSRLEAKAREGQEAIAAAQARLDAAKARAAAAAASASKATESRPPPASPAAAEPVTSSVQGRAVAPMEGEATSPPPAAVVAAISPKDIDALLRGEGWPAHERQFLRAGQGVGGGRRGSVGGRSPSPPLPAAGDDVGGHEEGNGAGGGEGEPGHPRGRRRSLAEAKYGHVTAKVDTHRWPGQGEGDDAAVEDKDPAHPVLKRGTGHGGGVTKAASARGFKASYGRRYAWGDVPGGSRIWMPGNLDLPAELGLLLDGLEAPEDKVVAQTLASREPSVEYLAYAERLRSLRLRDGGGLLDMLGIDLEATDAAVEAVMRAEGQAAGGGDGAGEHDATHNTSLTSRKALMLIVTGPAFGLDFAPAPAVEGEVWWYDVQAELEALNQAAIQAAMTDGRRFGLPPPITALPPDHPLSGRPIRWSNTVVHFISRVSPFHTVVSLGDPLVAVDDGDISGLDFEHALQRVRLMGAHATEADAHTITLMVTPAALARAKIIMRAELEHTRREEVLSSFSASGMANLDKQTITVHDDRLATAKALVRNERPKWNTSAKLPTDVVGRFQFSKPGGVDGFGKPIPGYSSPPPTAEVMAHARLAEVTRLLRSQRASYAEAAGMRGAVSHMFGSPPPSSRDGSGTARSSPRDGALGASGRVTSSSATRRRSGEVNPIVFAPITVQIDDDTVASCRAARGGYTIDVTFTTQPVGILLKGTVVASTLAGGRADGIVEAGDVLTRVGIHDLRQWKPGHGPSPADLVAEAVRGLSPTNPLHLRFHHPVIASPTPPSILGVEGLVGLPQWAADALAGVYPTLMSGRSERSGDEGVARGEGDIAGGAPSPGGNGGGRPASSPRSSPFAPAGTVRPEGADSAPWPGLGDSGDGAAPSPAPAPLEAAEVIAGDVDRLRRARSQMRLTLSASRLRDGASLLHSPGGVSPRAPGSHPSPLPPKDVEPASNADGAPRGVTTPASLPGGASDHPGFRAGRRASATPDDYVYETDYVPQPRHTASGAIVTVRPPTREAMVKVMADDDAVVAANMAEASAVAASGVPSLSVDVVLPPDTDYRLRPSHAEDVMIDVTFIAKPFGILLSAGVVPQVAGVVNGTQAADALQEGDEVVALAGLYVWSPEVKRVGGLTQALTKAAGVVSPSSPFTITFYRRGSPAVPHYDPTLHTDPHDMPRQVAHARQAEDDAAWGLAVEGGGVDRVGQVAGHGEAASPTALSQRSANADAPDVHPTSPLPSAEDDAADEAGAGEDAVADEAGADEDAAADEAGAGEDEAGAGDSGNPVAVAGSGLAVEAPPPVLDAATLHDTSSLDVPAVSTLPPAIDATQARRGGSASVVREGSPVPYLPAVALRERLRRQPTGYGEDDMGLSSSGGDGGSSGGDEGEGGFSGRPPATPVDQVTHPVPPNTTPPAVHRSLSPPPHSNLSSSFSATSDDGAAGSGGGDHGGAGMSMHSQVLGMALLDVGAHEAPLSGREGDGPVADDIRDGRGILTVVSPTASPALEDRTHSSEGDAAAFMDVSAAVAPGGDAAAPIGMDVGEAAAVESEVVDTMGPVVEAAPAVGHGDVADVGLASTTMDTGP